MADGLIPPAVVNGKRAATRAKRRSLGLCPECGQMAVPGRIRCESCIAKSARITRQRRSKFLTTRMCWSCGIMPSLPQLHGGTAGRTCETCYLKYKATIHLRSAKKWTVLRDILNRQDGRCAYSGEPIIIGVNDSIDHIFPISRFPHVRFEETNIQWVTRDVNKIKYDMTENEFFETIKSIHKRIASSEMAPVNESLVSLAKSLPETPRGNLAPERRSHQRNLGVLAPGEWSREYHCCNICGETERPHAAGGLCERCWQKDRANERGAWPRARIMAEACRDCSQVGRPYRAHGLCHACYARWRRREERSHHLKETG